jgi:hypothetical protein
MKTTRNFLLALAALVVNGGGLLTAVHAQSQPQKQRPAAGVSSNQIARPLAAEAATTIFACVNNHFGSLRIVSRTTTCRYGEYSLQWNQAGRKVQPEPRVHKVPKA